MLKINFGLFRQLTKTNPSSLISLHTSSKRKEKFSGFKTGNPPYHPIVQHLSIDTGSIINFLHPIKL